MSHLTFAINRLLDDVEPWEARFPAEPASNRAAVTKYDAHSSMREFVNDQTNVWLQEYFKRYPNQLPAYNRIKALLESANDKMVNIRAIIPSTLLNDQEMKNMIDEALGGKGKRESIQHLKNMSRLLIKATMTFPYIMEEFKRSPVDLDILKDEAYAYCMKHNILQPTQDENAAECLARRVIDRLEHLKSGRQRKTA